MSNLQLSLPEEQIALARRQARDAGYASVDEYVASLIDEQQARIEWEMLNEAQQRAVRRQIDEGWDQARRNATVDPDEVREALRTRSASRRAG